MHGTKRLAALIINWRGAADTLEVLQSLCNCQSDGLSVTAVVIDNASDMTDRMVLESGINELKERINIIFRSNSVNVGVPAAYNQAIQVAGLSYDYYLRLDNDVVVDPHGLDAMVALLEERSNEGVEIVGGNIKYFDRRSENNGGAVSIDLIQGKTHVDYPEANVVCDGVLGCIMLLSGDLVRLYAPEVFESALFICTDESALSLRAAGDGMRTIYLSRLIGFHKSGRSTERVTFLSNYFSARNWTLLQLRYVKGGQNMSWMLVRMPMDIIRSIIKGRWAFPLGWISGVGLAISGALDRRVRQGRC